MTIKNLVVAAIAIFLAGCGSGGNSKTGLSQGTTFDFSVSPQGTSLVFQDEAVKPKEEEAADENAIAELVGKQLGITKEEALKIVLLIPEYHKASQDYFNNLRKLDKVIEIEANDEEITKILPLLKSTNQTRKAVALKIAESVAPIRKKLNLPEINRFSFEHGSQGILIHHLIETEKDGKVEPACIFELGFLIEANEQGVQKFSIIVNDKRDEGKQEAPQKKQPPIFDDQF